jgi:hypothetical protein
MTAHASSERDEATELQSALAALASFQNLTQQVDAKANMLLAVHVGISTIIVTQMQTARTEGIASLRWVAILVYVVSFCMNGYALIQVMRPRTGLHPSRNAFAVPDGLADPSQGARTGGEGDTGPDLVTRRRSEEAWEAARAVALIAARKNHHVSRAIVWTSVMVVVAIASFMVTAFHD